VTRAFVAESRTNVYIEVEGMNRVRRTPLGLAVCFFAGSCHELTRAGHRCVAASRTGARRQWVTPRPFQCRCPKPKGRFISKLNLEII
jgi:hypothetical protein